MDNLERSVVDKNLGLILIHLTKMEKSSSFNKDYQHAKNYQKITGFIKNLRQDLVRYEQDFNDKSAGRGDYSE